MSSGAEADAIAAASVLAADVKCGVCNETITNAVLLSTCHHHFCRECAEDEIAKDDKCPECGIPTQPLDLRTDVTFQKMVDACVDVIAAVKSATSSPKKRDFETVAHPSDADAAAAEAAAGPRPTKQARTAKETPVRRSRRGASAAVAPGATAAAIEEVDEEAHGHDVRSDGAPADAESADDADAGDDDGDDAFPSSRDDSTPEAFKRQLRATAQKPKKPGKTYKKRAAKKSDAGKASTRQQKSAALQTLDGQPRATTTVWVERHAVNAPKPESQRTLPDSSLDFPATDADEEALAHPAPAPPKAAAAKAKAAAPPGRGRSAARAEPQLAAKAAEEGGGVEAEVVNADDSGDDASLASEPERDENGVVVGPDTVVHIPPGDEGDMDALDDDDVVDDDEVVVRVEDEAEVSHPADQPEPEPEPEPEKEPEKEPEREPEPGPEAVPEREQTAATGGTKTVVRKSNRRALSTRTNTPPSAANAGKTKDRVLLGSNAPAASPAFPSPATSSSARTTRSAKSSAAAFKSVAGGATPSPRPVDLYKTNHKGETRLHAAASKQDADRVAEYITLGASVNVRDAAGWTPLHEACANDDIATATLLINAKADVNAWGDKSTKVTPLHEAVSVKSIEIVRLLLEHGADPTVPDIKGNTVEELAKTIDIDDDVRRAVAEAASRAKATSGKQRTLRRTTEEAVAITLSGLKQDGKTRVGASAKKAGMHVENEFTPAVTHVVAHLTDTGLAQRTLKYMKAIVSGKPVVSDAWILACAEEHCIHDEAEYMPSGDSKCVDGGAAAKSVANAERGNPRLFDGCTFAMSEDLSDFVGVPPPTLEELITLGGGRVVNELEEPCSLPRVVPFHSVKKRGRVPCIFLVDGQEEPSWRDDGVARVGMDYICGCISRFEILPIP